VIDADGRVVHEVDLELPPQEVFDFFTDAQRLVRWIGLSASLAPVPGGRFRFEIQPGQFCEGSYVDVMRPTFVSFTWGWTSPEWNLPPGESLVSVAITATADGSRVRLIHDRLPGDLRPIHDEGWELFLARLTAAAAGDDPPGYPEEGTP
jgi:uncharacterized protein YndB with AHSA1/START domain